MAADYQKTPGPTTSTKKHGGSLPIIGVNAYLKKTPGARRVKKGCAGVWNEAASSKAA
jgi:hypothetical protein